MASEGTILVWVAVGGEIPMIARDAALTSMLSPAEIERSLRFHAEADRQRHVVGRVLARSMLTHIAGGAPGSWALEPDERGRPRVVGPLASEAPTFSITHTDGLVACAAARGLDVGLDAEASDRARDLLHLARRFFAPTEVAFLETRPEGLPGSFHTFWTLKEAYLKARGIGIGLPLDSFAFDLSSSPPGFSAEAATEPDPGSWRFRSWWPTERHAMAVASRASPAGEILVRDRVVTRASLAARD